MKQEPSPQPLKTARRAWQTAAALVVAFTGLASAAPSTTVVISQVYGGGGNNGATFTHDFVELHNISGSEQTITGWTLQYASATNSTNTWSTLPLTGTIPAGGYFLIQLASGGSNGVALPVAADATGGLNLAGANGKAALVSDATPLVGLGLPSATIVDFVGFGTSNSSETANAPAPSVTTSISRLDQGTTDTDNNSLDFVVTNPPAPRNSATPPYPTPGADTTPPAIATLSPTNGATGVAGSSVLTVTFNEDITLGSGTITVKAVSGDALFETFTVPSAAVSLTDRTLTLTPSNSFAPNGSYYVELSAGVVVDTAANPSAAVSGSGVWAFTVAGPDVTGPQIVSTAPVTGAVQVALDASYTINYDEELTVGTGNILFKDAVSGDTLLTLPVTDDSQVLVFGQQVILTPADQLQRDTVVRIEIPAGAFLDSLGNASPAVTGSTWTFSTVITPVNATVVINKLANAGLADRVELLVVGNGSVGSTLDMRGMIIKDFSSNGNNDGGGKFVFNDAPLWSAVPAGTLITLTGAATESPDVDGADFTLSLGLADTAYFTLSSGTFDVGATDLVVIKAAGSDVAGVAGAIHGFAVGAAGSQYNALTSMRLLAGTTLTTGNVIFVNNITSSIADYDGTDVSAPVSAANAIFGAANNGTNAIYLSQLRGSVLGAGDGLATLVNATPGSPFLGVGIFDRSQTAQTANVSLLASIEGVTLSQVNIAVPAVLGAPGAVTLAGSGSTGATVAVNGQTITITGAAVTTEAPLQVSIGGLVTPAPTLVTENGNYALEISTSPAGGTPIPTAAPAMVRVIIPISAVRDVTAAGVAVDLNSTVAISGVVTMANFGTANTQAFIQDETGGINVFSPTIFPSPLVAGTRVAVVGSLIQFNGLSEVSFANVTDVVSLGEAAIPAPVTLTIPDLLASAEVYEGSLVKVVGLTRVNETDIWGAARTVRLQDSAGNTIDIRIQGGSTALTEPGYPVTITGVLGQFDSASPFTTGYQIQPRSPEDLESTPVTGGDYASWAAANGISGEAADGDFDKDGISNFMEYALGLSPTAVNGSPGSFAGNVVSYTKGADALANGDVSYAIEVSTTLAPDSWTTPAGVVDAAGAISYTLPAGAGKIFARLVVTQED